MKTQEETLLKTPLQLGKMSKDELISYVDQLHNYVKNYQLAIDFTIETLESKNRNIS